MILLSLWIFFKVVYFEKILRYAILNASIWKVCYVSPVIFLKLCLWLFLFFNQIVRFAICFAHYKGVLIIFSFIWSNCKVCYLVCLFLFLSSDIFIGVVQLYGVLLGVLIFFFFPFERCAFWCANFFSFLLFRFFIQIIRCAIWCAHNCFSPLNCYFLYLNYKVGYLVCLLLFWFFYHFEYFSRCYILKRF